MKELRLAKIQTEEMCLIAIANNPKAFAYVIEQTKPIYLEAVKGDIENIHLVHDKQMFIETCEELGIKYKLS